MALNYMGGICNKFSLKIPMMNIPKQMQSIFKLLSIVSLICLLLLFYEMPNILGELKQMPALKFGATKPEKCDFNKRLIRRVKFPFSGIAIEVSCPFLDRIRIFNTALDHLRLDNLKKIHSKEWKNISAYEEIKFIGGSDDNFLQQLENFSQIETVFLPWIRNKIILPWIRNRVAVWSSFEDTSNILINKYFEWTADEKLCQWIMSPSLFMCDVIHNRTCVSDIEKTEKPQSLSLPALAFKPYGKESYLRDKERFYPPQFYQEPPPIAFYLHLIQDCIVTSYSEVWSGDMYLVPRTCSYRTNKRPPQNIDKIPLHDEVIALSQYWGEGTFHGMIEVIPRLSLYVDFLRRNPQIKILAPSMRGRTVELLAILGLNKNRIISGTCRAKLLYLPRPTMCGCANIQEIQVISLRFRKYINEKLKTEPRKQVILIRRTRNRKFTDHESIERMVKESAAEHNLSFVLFPDNPVPSLNKTMIMFHSAVMVIAPHGAGLSNVVFSQPGTYVIEGVCNPPLINLCYQRLSKVLGHHWHGILSRGGCLSVVNVSVSDIKTAVERHLELLKK